MGKKKGPKGKLPAMMFYVRDWLGDPALQMASPTSRGIWMNLLCYMWEARYKGELEGTVEEFQKLGGAGPTEIQTFFDEARRLGFCDISQESPGIVTVTNRRMSQAEAERLGARNRKRLQREREAEKKGVTPDVTPDVTGKSHTPLSVAVSSSCHNSDIDSSEQSPEETPPEPKNLLSIQLIKRDGLFHVNEDDIEEWEEVFPGINVLACLKYIRTWNKDNKKRRKTAVGIRRHITTWLEKEQNKGARSTYFKHTDPEQAKQFKHRHKIPGGQLCGECQKFGACGTGAGSQVCVQKSLAFKERPNKFLEEKNNEQNSIQPQP
jgi:hypothetical protein